ncbi:MAG: low molecular weight phosphotyrosine protein phosphatase [Rhodospirillales bacterium]|nr:low molecular weight phosphotyrosine protein phosphatase [Rhodospirillales bacterium]
MVSILFVCLGNICRSPSAEGVFRAQVETAGLADTVTTDSAGTYGFHIGRPPDQRALAAARRRGVDLSGLRARQVAVEDFSRFDLILAMDRDNLADLMALCPEEERHRVRLFLDFAPGFDIRDVPDPYYGGEDDFDFMLDLIEAGARGLLDHLCAAHL